MTPDKVKEAIANGNELLKSLTYSESMRRELDLQPHTATEMMAMHDNREKIEKVRRTIKTLIDLAQSVVDAKMPEGMKLLYTYPQLNEEGYPLRDDGDFRNQGYNQALSDFRLYLINRLAGLEEMIQSAIMAYNVNEASISVQYLKENPKCLMNYLAQAIRKYLLGGEKYESDITRIS